MAYLFLSNAVERPGDKRLYHAYITL